MAKKIKKCTNCGGTGWVTQPAQTIDKNSQEVLRPDLPTIVICPACKGEGNWEVDED